MRVSASPRSASQIDSVALRPGNESRNACSRMPGAGPPTADPPGHGDRSVGWPFISAPTLTGASGAICGEIARRLAKAGVQVAATARPSDRLDAIASHDNITAFPADVLDVEALKTCAAKVEEVGFLGVCFVSGTSL